MPNRNRPWEPAAGSARSSRDYREYRKQARESFLGVPITGTGRPVLAEPPDEVQRTLTERWQAGGGMPFLGAYTDVLVDRDANDVVAEFMRDRIRETVADPAVAELLCPRTYPVGAKRLCQSDDYYAMFNRPNVTLVDIRSAPLDVGVGRGGLKTADAFYELDALVFATGFDAMTRARCSRSTSAASAGSRWPTKWVGRAARLPGRRPPPGSRTCSSSPGPGRPSVFSNMVLSIEQHVEWIRDCIAVPGRRAGTPRRRPTAVGARTPGWST